MSQGSSDTGFCGSMEKKDKRRKKLDDGKPNAENVINELLEGVDLKQGPTGEADSKYSCLPIKRAGSNKQAGWIISETLTNKQAVINKQGGILVSIQ